MSAPAAAPPGQVGSVRRLEPAALVAVMSRDVTIFGRYWKATTFSSIVQPTIYLLAFGLGLGLLLPHVQGVTYVQYVATGVVATAVLFSSAFPGMFNTFVRWQFQRTYDAMLAAPLDVEELITAEVLWISIRAGLYGVAPLLVGIAFGLPPEPGMLLVPFIAFSRLPASRRSAWPSPRWRKRSTTSTTSRARCSRRCFSWRARLPDLHAAGRRARRRAVQPALSLRAARARRLAPAIGLGLVDLYHAGVPSSSRCSCGAWRSPSWAGG